MSTTRHSMVEGVVQSQADLSIAPYLESIELSDLFMNCYSRQKTVGFEPQFEEVEEWLAGGWEDNVPLVIFSKRGQGKKVFTVQWIEHHLRNSKKEFKDVVIPLFVTLMHSESSPFSVVYRLLTRLRHIFSLQHRIDHSEEKLRKSFEYWLNLVSRRIKSTSFFDGDLIIVIEGASLLRERDQVTEASLRFWLPKVLPERVRLILTLDEFSYNMPYLRSMGCRFVEVVAAPNVAAELATLLEQTEKAVEEEKKKEAATGKKEEEKDHASPPDESHGKRQSRDLRNHSGNHHEQDHAKRHSRASINPHEDNPVRHQSRFHGHEEAESWENENEIICFAEQRDFTGSKDELIFRHQIVLALCEAGRRKEVSSFYCKIALSAFFPQKKELAASIRSEAAKIEAAVRDSGDEETLISFILDYFEDKLLPKEKYSELLSLLILNFKGLSPRELCRGAGISREELVGFLEVFGVFLLAYGRYLKITSPSFLGVFLETRLHDPSVRRAAHARVAAAVSGGKISVRSLEEQAHNLLAAGEFFALKQKLAPVENFIVLFNEISKFDLFRFWKKLEERNYDPVQEYNKSFELFVMHFNPSDDQIFALNLQFTLFFKELSDFEGPGTPEFRHPLLLSKIIQAPQNGAARPTPPRAHKTRVHRFTSRVSVPALFEIYNLYPPLFETKSEPPPAPPEDLQLEKEGKVINFLHEISLLRELRDLQICGDGKGKILKSHERLNIDIPLNREKFLQHFQGILAKKNAFKSRRIEQRPEPLFQASGPPTERRVTDELLLIEGESIEVDPFTKQILEIDLAIAPTEESGFYYYKRWIWMNFPIIALADLPQGFSEAIRDCYSRGSNFLDLDKELQRYFTCLLIVEDCKRKRASTQKPFANLQAGTEAEAESFSQKLALPAIKPPKMSRSERNLSTLTQADLPLKQLTSSISGISRHAQSQVLSVISTLRSNMSTAQLEKVLQCSKFIGQGMMKSNVKDMRKEIFGEENRNASVEEYYKKIANLDTLFQKWSRKEVEFLQQKGMLIIRELNKFTAKKLELLRQLEKVAPSLSQSTKTEKNTPRLEDSAKLMARLRRTESIRTRYQQIEDICLLNQVQNEEWIRNVNFYLGNLKKVRKEKEAQVHNEIAAARRAKAERKSVLERFNSQKAKKEEFKLNFRKYIFQKASIDKAIILSDMTILNKVQSNLETLSKNELASRSQKNNIVVEPHIDPETEAKYLKADTIFEQVAKIFLSGGPDAKPEVEDIDPNWRRNPAFKRAAFELEAAKNIRRAIFEEQVRIEELRSLQQDKKPRTKPLSKHLKSKTTSNRNFTLPPVKSSHFGLTVKDAIAELHLSTSSVLDKLSVFADPLNVSFSKEIDLEEVFLKTKLLLSSATAHEKDRNRILESFPFLASKLQEEASPYEAKFEPGIPAQADYESEAEFAPSPSEQEPIESQETTPPSDHSDEQSPEGHSEARGPAAGEAESEKPYFPVKQARKSNFTDLKPATQLSTGSIENKENSQMPSANRHPL